MYIYIYVSPPCGEKDCQWRKTACSVWDYPLLVPQSKKQMFVVDPFTRAEKRTICDHGIPTYLRF